MCVIFTSASVEVWPENDSSPISQWMTSRASTLFPGILIASSPIQSESAITNTRASFLTAVAASSQARFCSSGSKVKLPFLSTNVA